MTGIALLIRNEVYVTCSRKNEEHRNSEKRWCFTFFTVYYHNNNNKYKTDVIFVSYFRILHKNDKKH